MRSRKILILSSHAGGGHRSASRALTDLIGDDYEVAVVNAFEDILSPVDVVKLISQQRWSVEHIYNKLLRAGWTGVVNQIVGRVMRPLVSANRMRFRQLFKTHFAHQSPDLVISVVPFINWPASDAAYELSIPYVMMAIDGDITNYVDRIDRLVHRDVHLTVMRDNPILDTQLDRLGLESRLTVHRVGIPLRRQFFVMPDREALRRKYRVPPGKFVATLMMGALGGQAAHRFARTVSAMRQDIHLIVCVGSNPALGGMLKAIERSPQVSMAIQEYTDHTEEILAVTDVLITKPGPSTIQEAIKMEVPMLLDNTHRPLYWERANIDLVRFHGIGHSVDGHQALPWLIECYRTDVRLRCRQRAVLKRLSSSVSQAELRRVVDEGVARAGDHRNPNVNRVWEANR